MVKVAGGSKGCRTCRRRRVKCDERQPLCTRCEKGGFDCSGFGKDLSFVSENGRAQRRSRKQEALRAKAFESGRDSPEEFLVADSDRSIVIRKSNAAPTTANRIWPQLNYSAFKNDIQISFTLAKLFSSDRRAIAWLGCGYNTDEYHINSDALKALSSLYYGRVNHESSIENDARVYYSKTLRGLNDAILSDGGTSLDVLLAGMTASCYEMIASPTYVGALLHAGGVGRLIELRGPEQHRNMFELHILSTMRGSICMKAMLDRKRCFLEREEWKTIPWSLHPEEKTMTRCVQDIMCDIPGLLEDYDAILASDISPKTYQLRFENLKAAIDRNLGLLSDWRVLWEQIYPVACYEQASHFPQSPFPTALHYHDIEIANGLMLYNALYIRITEIARELLGADFDYRQVAMNPNFQCTNPLLNPPGASLDDAAMEICRSVEYHLSPPHGSAGAFFIIFPLKKAYDELPSGCTEKEWLKSVMVNLATRDGFLCSTGILLQKVE